MTPTYPYIYISTYIYTYNHIFKNNSSQIGPSTIPWRANVRVAAHIEKRCGNYSSTMRRNGGFNKEPRDFTINVTHVN